MKIDRVLLNKVLYCINNSTEITTEEVRVIHEKLLSEDVTYNTNNTYNITINGGATSIGDGWDD